MKATAYLAAFLLMLFRLAAPSFAEDTVPGHAVLARPTGDALVIWNASQVVASIVRSKMTEADADNLLERDAVRILTSMSPHIDKSAKTITVRIIYAKSGEVSPIYNTPTFKGFEQYALLMARAQDIPTNLNKWKELQENHAVPAGLTYKVVGRLPPRL
jgi:hypothetical protein